jgi:hypothetical protein
VVLHAHIMWVATSIGAQHSAWVPGLADTYSTLCVLQYLLASSPRRTHGRNHPVDLPADPCAAAAMGLAAGAVRAVPVHGALIGAVVGAAQTLLQMVRHIIQRKSLELATAHDEYHTFILAGQHTCLGTHAHGCRRRSKIPLVALKLLPGLQLFAAHSFTC